jgi:asparagine synthase (glutamine-hydrolysing)
MGAHAGVVFFDRRPTGDVGRTLIAGLKPIAPDGVSSFAHDGVLLAYGACHVWTGERTSRQPRQSTSGLVMTWDGRLDNRDDLRQVLGPMSSQDSGDAAIALATFERWGVEGLGRLIGDWSLVIWDGRQRTLYFARDYMGVRPLYYYQRAGQSVAWSSSLGDLVSRIGCGHEFDERFVARFMTLRNWTDVTPYRGVCAVPTAHCVSLSAERTDVRRFWHLEPGIVRYRDRRAYEEQMRALWREAVGTRLRAEGTVWAELSGGLDSSSVVCMADALVKERRVDATAIQPLSHVAARSPEGDERRFIAAVETQIGTNSRIMIVEDHKDDCDAGAAWVTPSAARGVGLASIRQVREHGGRLVLSGRAGDAVMGCFPDNSVAVLDDVADGRLLAAAAGVRQWSRATRKPFLEIGWQLIRQSLPAASTPLADGPLNETQAQGANLLTRRLQSLIEQVPDVGLLAATSAIRPSKRHLAKLLLGYAIDARLSLPMLPPDVTYTYPFVHRPLVEFVMAIPGEELSAPGRMRSLMRRSFEGLLPPRVLERTSKGYYPPAAMRALRPLAEAARPVDRLEVVQRGWIDPERLDAAIRLVIDGGAATGGEVLRALRLEQWLTARHRRQSAEPPTQKGGERHEVLNA